MQRLFGHPVFGVSLWLMWLLLNGFTLGQALLGLVVSAGAVLAFTALDPDPVRIRSVRAIVELFVRVFIDILQSNIAVIRIIWTSPQPREPGFVAVKLKLRGRLPLAILACIVTSTPGTAWVNFNSASGELLIHILDKGGEETFRAVMKQHYERLLLEIFG